MKKAVLSAVCAAICLISPIAGHTASAQTLTMGEGLDFSRRGYGYASFSASEFLKDYGVELFNGEEEYLNGNSEFNVKYTGKIASGFISADYDGEAELLTVTPGEYSYTAVNGQNVTWRPYAVNGVNLSGGSCVLSPAPSAEDYVTVSYRASLKIDKSYVNSVLNEYYNAASSAYEKITAKREEYNAAAEKYAADKKAYDNYLAVKEQYKSDFLKYSKYLEEYEKWEIKNRPYQTYLKEYAEYQKEYEAYVNYDPQKALEEYYLSEQRYRDYLAALNDYNVKYWEYLNSLNTPQMELVKKQLAILDYMYTVAGNNRTIRNAVMGDSVTQVLSHKEELKLAGADGTAVDKAGRSTNILRNLIGNYESLHGEEEKYAFYITSYEVLRDNFSDLLRCLDYFYRNAAIKAYIREMGKSEQFEILIAQLFQISNALDNGTVANYEKKYKFKDPAAADFDGNYKINGRSPAQILGNSLLADDNNALPLEDGYPDLPEPPEKPQEVERLPYPERPATPPVPPEEVPAPGDPPQEVPCPAMPQEVPCPVMPQEYVPTQTENSLYNAYVGGLTLREEVNSDYDFVITTDVVKYFRNCRTVTVYFYLNKDDAEYITFAEGEWGSYIGYPPEAALPVKEKRGYDCTFEQWLYKSDGAAVDWDNLPQTEIVEVYASFTETPKNYPVTWIVDGKEITAEYPYGSIPQFDGVPQKQAEGRRNFRFTGWNRQTEPVTDSLTPVRYVAQFERSLLIKWKIGEDVIYSSVWKGEKVEYPGELPQSMYDALFVYAFDGWDKDLSQSATSDEEYTAVFAKKYILPVNNGGAIVSVDGEYLFADCSLATSDEFLLDSVLQLAKQMGYGVIISTRAYSATFSANEVIGFAAENAYRLKISLKRKNNAANYAEYLYSAKFYGDGGGEIACQTTFTFSAFGIFDKNYSRLFRTSESGNLAEVRAEVSADTITFRMQGGPGYRTYPLYAVNAVRTEGIELSLNTQAARRGDTITVTLGEPPAGRYVIGLYATDAAGNDIKITDNRFVMPSSPVTVGVVLGYLEYTVTFKSDGKIISKKTYRYGQQIAAPSDPVKAPDGDYSYEFTGWDKEFSTVEGDAEFNAVFSAVPLEGFETPSKPSRFMTLFYVGIAAVCAVIAGIAVTVGLVIYKKRKKSKKQPN